MGNKRPELTRVVKFYLLRSPPDANPIAVKCGCHAIDVTPGA